MAETVKSTVDDVALDQYTAEVTAALPAICAEFGLGRPVDATFACHRTHRVWRLVTDQGTYAVKHLNAEVFRGDVGWLENAAAFERMAIAAGVPAPSVVLAASGAAVARLPGRAEAMFVRVHEWVSGRPLAMVNQEDHAVRAVARALAVTHGLRHPTRFSYPLGMWRLPEPADLELLDRAVAAGWTEQATASGVRDCVDLLEALFAVRRGQDRELVTAHRDLAPHNVLVTGDRAVVLDWDTAGPWTAAEELAATAAEWAGGATAEPKPEVAAAVVTEYLRAGGVLTDTGPELFATWLVKQLDWTLLQIRRALAPRDLPPDRRPVARAAATRSLVDLARAPHRVEQWTTWLREAR